MSQTQVSPQSGYAPGNPANLATVVYRSRAVAPLSAAELYRLTIEAQARNRREAITGVMLYDDRKFFQWLEGPSDGVDRVMHSIRNDPRHTDIEVLDDKPARARAFGEWNMKLATRESQEADLSPEIFEPPIDVLNDLRARPSAAPAVLVKLVPRPARQSGMTQTSRGPLGRSTASVLKNIILSAVIPALAKQHGVAELGRQPLRPHPRVAELADLLIASDETAARELIDELHAEQGTVWPLYSNLFEPAARSLGDLWAEDSCSEFDVTLGLCRMQTAARLLSAHAPRKSAARQRAATVLITPEPGELHRLGAALDQEVLWNAGWDPQCEYPATDKILQDLVASTWFDALDVSLSAAFEREQWLPRLTETIAGARRASRNPSLVVVVGGRIFVDHKTSGAEVGADLTSMTALCVDDLISRGIAQRDADAGGA